MNSILYHHRTRGVGAEGAHIKAITQALREQGMEVELFSLTGIDPTQPAAPASSAPAKKSRMAWLSRNLPEWLFELLELAYNLVVARPLSRKITPKTDLIYERYSLFLFIGVWLAQKKQIPIILEVNDSAVVDRVRPLLFKRLATRIERWIFRHASGLVFISEEFQRIATLHHGSIAPSVISPNAANLAEFDAAHYTPEQEKSALGLEGKLVLGFVGAFHHWHGIHWYVASLLPVLKADPHIALLLVGDGPYHGQIAQQVEEANLSKQVVMTGRIPHNHVARTIAAMDVGILPDSNVYGSPMKLFEFMAMKVPMICPAYPPVVEVVDDTVTGWLFPPNDREGSIAATTKVMGLGHDAIKQVGEHAYRYIVEHRQWHHNASQLLSLAKQVTKESV